MTPTHARILGSSVVLRRRGVSAGLTFGSIAALFGLTSGIIDQDQYTVLAAAVIASAVVPTLIAEKWFRPKVEPIEEETNGSSGVGTG